MNITKENDEESDINSRFENEISLIKNIVKENKEKGKFRKVEPTIIEKIGRDRFNKTLRELHENLLSSDAIGRLLGVSFTTVRRWSDDLNLPSFKDMRRVYLAELGTVDRVIRYAANGCIVTKTTWNLNSELAYFVGYAGFGADGSLTPAGISMSGTIGDGVYQSLMSILPRFGKVHGHLVKNTNAWIIYVNNVALRPLFVDSNNRPNWTHLETIFGSNLRKDYLAGLIDADGFVFSGGIGIKMSEINLETLEKVYNTFSDVKPRLSPVKKSNKSYDTIKRRPQFMLLFSRVKSRNLLMELLPRLCHINKRNKLRYLLAQPVQRTWLIKQMNLTMKNNLTTNKLKQRSKYFLYFLSFN